jgi:hypothetical protein
MTKQEKLAVKAWVEAQPHLFSARMNRDYETMASVFNEQSKSSQKMSILQMHECMLEQAQE